MGEQENRTSTTWSDTIFQSFLASLLFAFAGTLFCIVRGKRVPWDVSAGLFFFELTLAMICFSAFAAGGLAISRAKREKTGVLVMRALYLAFPVIFGFHWLIEVATPINRRLNLSSYLLITAALAAAWIGSGLLSKRSTTPIGQRTLLYWFFLPVASMLYFTLYLQVDGPAYPRFPLFYGAYAVAFILTAVIALGREGAMKIPARRPPGPLFCAAAIIAAAGVLAFSAHMKGTYLDSSRAYGPSRVQAIPGNDPNVIMISLDTLRADHLSCYGYTRNTSPNLDSLAARGARFEYAIAQAPWTLPSHSSIFTSRYPYRLESHGIGEEPSLPEMFKKRGYTTVAFTGGDFVSESVYGKHFDFFDDESEELYHVRHQTLVTTLLRLRLYARRFGISMKPLNVFNGWRFRGPNLRVARASSSAQVRNASRWLNERGRENSFFLFLHTYSIHDYFLNRKPARNNAEMFNPGYDGMLEGVSLDYHSTYPSAQADIDRIVALYDGEIFDADRELGKLMEDLQELGLWDNTLIVLFSDHGEGFDPGLGRLWHGDRLNEDLLHVPLIMAYPGKILEGKVVSSQVALLDIMPTILDFIGIEIPDGVEGTSLKPAITLDGDEVGPRNIFSEVAGLDTSGVSLRTETHKYIRHPGRTEFYALVDDPKERVNLAHDAPEAMKQIEPLVDDFYTKAARKITYDQETIDRMRAVGYLR